MIPIYTIMNLVEASAIEAALKEAGIKFVIRYFTDSAYDGIFVAQKGYGQVLVEEINRAAAEEIIAEISEKGTTGL